MRGSARQWGAVRGSERRCMAEADRAWQRGAVQCSAGQGGKKGLKETAQAPAMHCGTASEKPVQAPPATGLCPTPGLSPLSKTLLSGFAPCSSPVDSNLHAVHGQF